MRDGVVNISHKTTNPVERGKDNVVQRVLPGLSKLTPFFLPPSGIHSRVPSPGISPALWYPPLSYANPAVVPAINAYISITLLPRLLPTTPVTHLLRDATSVIDELLEWQGASSELPNGEFSWVEYGLSFRVWQEGHANGAVTLGVLNAAVTALIAGMQKEGSWKAAAFVIYNGLQEVGRGTLG